MYISEIKRTNHVNSRGSRASRLFVLRRTHTHPPIADSPLSCTTPHTTRCVSHTGMIREYIYGWDPKMVRSIFQNNIEYININIVNNIIKYQVTIRRSRFFEPPKRTLAWEILSTSFFLSFSFARSLFPLSHSLSNNRRRKSAYHTRCDLATRFTYQHTKRLHPHFSRLKDATFLRLKDMETYDFTDMHLFVCV